MPYEYRPHDRMQRAMDICVSAGALVLLLPVLLVIGALITLKMGRPVLFRQVRAGREEVPFELLKFRTMHDVDPQRGRLSDAERLTSIGQWLRATSLDELPNLWNVLRGDMSLVGPRPQMIDFLGRYTAAQVRRHAVRPGVTGLAQVNGRNAISWEARFKLDVWYVDHRSILLDLYILAKTLRIVLRRTGISAEGHVTMPVFQGTGAATPEIAAQRSRTTVDV